MDSLSRIRLMVDNALPGMLVPVESLRAVLDEVGALQSILETQTTQAPATWRERLWTCPPDTRLGVAELSEALGRPK